MIKYAKKSGDTATVTSKRMLKLWVSWEYCEYSTVQIKCMWTNINKKTIIPCMLFKISIILNLGPRTEIQGAPAPPKKVKTKN